VGGEKAMLEYVFSLWGMVIVAVVCSSLATIVGSIAKNWRKAREAEYEATVKVEMIKQGRSVEEIERVLRTTGKDTAQTV
jgi:hypothetical protein